MVKDEILAFLGDYLPFIDAHHLGDFIGISPGGVDYITGLIGCFRSLHFIAAVNRLDGGHRFA